jgi:hypothetical protein
MSPRARRSQYGNSPPVSADRRADAAGQRGLAPHGRTTPIAGRHDRREVERFLRAQPVAEIPRRSGPAHAPGLIALPLLGYRVIRRLD